MAEGYSPEYNALDKVQNVKDALTFTTQMNYTIKLTNLGSRNLSNVSVLNNTIPNNTSVYLQILNQTTENNSIILYCIVYIEYNQSYFENINEGLLSSSNYFFCQQCGNEFTPYSWELLVPNYLFINNTSGVDLSNFDSLKTSLMNMYSQQTVTHAGFLITIIVATLTIFLTFFAKTKETKALLTKRVFRYFGYIIFIALVSLTCYLTLRLLFWSWMTNASLTITPSEAIRQNSPSIISGIQNCLLDFYKHLNGPSLPSTLFYLDSWANLPLSILIVLPFSGFLTYLFFSLLINRKVIIFDRIYKYFSQLKELIKHGTSTQYFEFMFKVSRTLYLGFLIGLASILILIAANFLTGFFSNYQIASLISVFFFEGIVLALLLYEISMNRKSRIIKSPRTKVKGINSNNIQSE